MIDLLLLMAIIILTFLAIAVSSVEYRLREVCKHLSKISKELRYRDTYTDEELKKAGDDEWHMNQK